MRNSAPQIPLADNIADLEALVAHLKNLQDFDPDSAEPEEKSEHLALIEVARVALINTRRAIRGKVMPALHQRLELEEQEAL